MDFASGLANLEQAAANSQNPRNDNRRRGRANSHGGGDDNRRYQPRPRHHHHDNHHRRGGDHHNRRGDHRRDHHHHQQHDRSLDGLARFGYRFPRGPYRRPPPIPAKSDRPLHICLLAITIDDLPYEAIWKAWAQSESNNSRYKTSLCCHAKFPDRVKSDWLKQRLLLQPRRIVRGNSLSDPEYLTHKPAWGSVEITRGMIDLLVQGMEIGRGSKDNKHHHRGGDRNRDDDPRFSPNRFFIGEGNPPPVDKFIFISETCVPVMTLEECMKALFAAEKKRQLITSDAPRWEPPPAAKKEAASKKKQEQEGPSWDDDKEGEKIEVGDSSNTTKEEKEEKEAKPVVMDLADLPINRKKRPEEEPVVYLDTSWVNARNFNSPNTPQNKYERDQFNNIHRNVPKRYRYKADQWMVLSRQHAAAILDIDHYYSNNIQPKDQLWNSFRRINASDEMYFPTTLSLANVLIDNNPSHRPGATASASATATEVAAADSAASAAAASSSSSCPWIERRQVTYTDWSMGMRNPASFTKGIRDFSNIARVARKQKTLFARKFCPYVEIPGQDASSIKRTGDITVEEWRHELQTIIEQEKEQQEPQQREEGEGDTTLTPAEEAEAAGTTNDNDDEDAENNNNQVDDDDDDDDNDKNDGEENDNHEENDDNNNDNNDGEGNEDSNDGEGNEDDGGDAEEDGDGDGDMNKDGEEEDDDEEEEESFFT